MRAIILGTAGHVDHGKTSFIRALTGVDCDRLKEEKEDGLSSNEGISRWFQLEETAPLPMPLSARQMFSHYLKFGRFTKEIYAGITDKEQATFHILRET